MTLKIVVALAVALAALAAYVATRPAEFRVSRSARLAAPPEAVFVQVNELKRWEAWSPWAKKDPQMKQTYAGPAAGTGASTAWAVSMGDILPGPWQVVHPLSSAWAPPPC